MCRAPKKCTAPDGLNSAGAGDVVHPSDVHHPLDVYIAQFLKASGRVRVGKRSGAPSPPPSSGLWSALPLVCICLFFN